MTHYIATFSVDYIENSIWAAVSNGVCGHEWGDSPIIGESPHERPQTSSSHRRQVDYRSLIIENYSRRFHWLACKK